MKTHEGFGEKLKLKCVVDIGAYVGKYSFYTAKQVGNMA